MNVYLVRHTTPDIERDTCYGQLDINVKESFEEELERAKQHLPSNLDFVCYASPLLRCAKLAQALHSKEIHFDSRLKELDFGEWEGKPWADLDPEVFSNWMEDFTEKPAPGGESYRALYNRCLEFWEELKQKKQENILIVAHGGSIRALLMQVLGIPLPNLYRFELAFGSVSHIQVKKGKEKVMFINR